MDFFFFLSSQMSNALREPMCVSTEHILIVEFVMQSIFSKKFHFHFYECEELLNEVLSAPKNPLSSFEAHTSNGRVENIEFEKEKKHFELLL